MPEFDLDKVDFMRVLAGAGIKYTPQVLRLDCPACGGWGVPWDRTEWYCLDCKHYWLPEGG